jgi:hypothetical protein
MLAIGDDTGDEVPAKLRPLVESFLSSPFNAAPERAKELRQICDQKDIQVYFKANAPDWLFEEFHMYELNRIKIGSRSIERLWAYCYAYTTIATELRKKAKGHGGTENEAEYKLAFYLLKWAKQERLQDIEGDWPDCLPNPSHVDVLEHVKAANHYFLMTSGRLLLHEIAHMVLPHHTDPDTPKNIQKDEEMDADRWADSWMLDKWSEFRSVEAVFIGRCMGIAFAHAPSLIFGADRLEPSLSHPTPIERIKSFVKLWLPGGNPSDKRPVDEPCAFLALMIVHVLFEKNIQVALEPYPSTYTELFERFAPYFK